MYSAPTSTSCLCPKVLRAAAVLLIAAATSAAAADIAFTVRIAGPPDLETGTHATITVPLLITNRGTSRTLVVEPMLPDGWRTVAGSGDVSLGPDAEELRLVSILVPSHATAGRHAVRFTVRETRDGGAAAEVQLAVTVRAEPALSLLLLERPPFVVAGATYMVAFALVNTGNTLVRPGLSVSESLGLSVELPPDPGPLSPGSQLTVTVRISSDARIRSPVTHRITLSVGDLSAAGGAADPASVPRIAFASCDTEIIPLSVAGQARWHTLHLDTLTAANAGLSESFTAGLKETLDLSGTLDEAGQHRLQADVVKEIGTGLDPLFSPQDRYSIAWTHRLGSAALGDGSFSLSPLLAWEVQGRGIQAAFTPPGFSIGAMYYSNPWTGTTDPWLGALAGASFPRSAATGEAAYQVNAALLWPFDDMVTIGLWQTLRPLPGVDIRLDTALQLDGAGGVAPALLAEASAGFGPVTAALRFLRAWPEFDAAWHDEQAIHANLSSALLDGNFTLSGAFSLEDTNLLRDPGLPSADRTVSVSLQASGNVPEWDSSPMVYLQLASRRDLLPAPDYAWFDAIVNLTWRQGFPGLDLYALASMDRRQDLLDGLSATTLAGELDAEWPLNDALGMFTMVRYNGRFDDTGGSQHGAGWRIGARVALGATDLEASTRTTWSFSNTGFAGFVAGIGASGSHRFPWGHTIRGSLDVSLGRDLIAWDPEFRLSISYGASTDVPLYRMRDAATVRGRVFLVADGSPREGVLLRLNGLAAITDAHGDYVFNVPKAGELHLQVDRGTLGTGMVPMRPTPIDVDAAAGSVTVIDIGIVQSASLSGTVSVWGFPEGSTFDPAGEPDTAVVERTRLGGLGSIVLELVDATGTVRRLTNSEGRFHFSEMRPGRYTLAVIGGLIPTYHHVEQDGYDVVLEPGQDGSLEIRILQERRRIQMVDAAPSRSSRPPPAGLVSSACPTIR